MNAKMAVERKRALKVYSGNLDGRHTAIMARHSFKEFYAATRITRDFASQTGNDEEIRQAMSEPGVVFVRPINARYGDAWWKIGRNDGR